MLNLRIDADSIAYRAAAAAEKRSWTIKGETIPFQYKKEAIAFVKMNNIEDPDYTLHIEPEDKVNALHNAKSIIENIKEAFKGDELTYTLYLTGDENYRDEIATIRKYKGNRDNLRRPHWLKAVRSYMISTYGAEVVDGYEADDALSLNLGLDDIMISIDKDLDTVAGTHYNWVKEESYYVSPKQADYNFNLQMLMGDTVDNIQGVPGMGIVGAKKILDASDNYKCDVGLAYAEAYENSEEAYEENARLLHMSRKTPNDWSWDK